MMKMRRNIGRIIKRVEVPISLERRDPGTFLKGRFVDDATPTVTAEVASVQPVTGDEVQRLGEGRRTSEAKKMYSRFEVLPGDAPNNQQPDRVTYEGEVYQVESAEGWDDTGEYFKSMLLKVGQ